MSRPGIGERPAWDDFPPVIRHGDRGTLKNEPEYEAANPAICSPLLIWLTDDIVIKQKMLDDINNKHGPLMKQYWRENSGYGIDQLTQGEAGHLRRAASVDKIRDRLAKARHEGIKRLDRQGVGTSLRSERGESAQRTEVSEALEQNYQEILGSYILAKYEQAAHIESRLEHLIERRQTHVQQRQLSPPGFLSLPAKRKAWQAQQARRQAGLNRLRARLKTVQKIKSGIRIEAFASSETRKENPQLARDWDAMRQAKRHSQGRAKNRIASRFREHRSSGPAHAGLWHSGAGGKHNKKCFRNLPV